MSVRELVRAIQAEMRSSIDITPDRASELLMQASALMGNCMDEVRASDQAYKQILLHCLRTAEKANRARIEAETSPQYARWQEARDTYTLVVEMIRSLKVFIRSKQEEMRLAR